ncbi:MAG: Maf family protein [Phycisphaerales bacterium]|nr:Maf family protein [Phycisphaerales bacterium]
MNTRPLWLASASPRRRRLLEQAGFAAVLAPPALDDARLSPVPCPIEHRVAALAWFKAAQIVRTLRGASGASGGVVLAADTVCDIDGEPIGKPTSPEQAAALLERMQERTHRTCTGVCVYDLAGSRRSIFVDVASVTLGALDRAQIAQHLEHRAWVGKAGGYNFAEQVDAGWPLACVGDPTSVMGLPMRRLQPLLESILDERGAA